MVIMVGDAQAESMRFCCFVLLLAGCDGAPVEVLRPDSGRPPVVADAATDAGPPEASCLRSGGALEVMRVIDNNVVTDHGQLRTLDWAPNGQVAVSSTDGAIKLWTVDGDAAGGLRPGEPGYDAAFGEGTAMVTALAYAPGALWAGDETGRVVRYRTADFEPGAETALDGPVVALDAAGERWVALTDRLTFDDGTEQASPLTETRAVALDPLEGAWVAGQLDGSAAIGRVGEAVDVTTQAGAFSALAVDGARVAAAGDAGLALRDADGLRVLSEVAASGVAFAPGGDALLSVEDGRVVARDLDGAELSAVDLPGALDVRSLPGRDHAVAIDAASGIHVLGCR